MLIITCSTPEINTITSGQVPHVCLHTARSPCRFGFSLPLNLTLHRSCHSSSVIAAPLRFQRQRLASAAPHHLSLLFNLPFPSSLCQFMMFPGVIPARVDLVSRIFDPRLFSDLDLSLSPFRIYCLFLAGCSPCDSKGWSLSILLPESCIWVQ